MNNRVTRMFGKWRFLVSVSLLVAVSGGHGELARAAGLEGTIVEATGEGGRIVDVGRLNPTAVEIIYDNQQRLTLDFYGENIFRLFRDNAEGVLREPEARPEARVLVERPRRAVGKLNVRNEAGRVAVSTDKVEVAFDKTTGLMTVTNRETGVVVLEEAEPVVFEKDKVTVTLKERAEEYFYGGGVQNGRFSHKGKAIAIENQNRWTDGGVASPNPFYWSTGGIRHHVAHLQEGTVRLRSGGKR